MADKSRRWVLTVAFILLFPMLCVGQEEAPRPVLSAAEFDLERWEGHVIFVDFWASWCGPCKKSMPWLSQMQQKYETEGLVVVAVNLDRKLASASRMLDSLYPGIQVVHDPEGKLAGQYELEGMPSAFLYDRKGELIARHVGFLAAESADKEEQIRQLLMKETLDE